jgi:NADH-quinone oxidoreductase subunit J
MMDAVNLVFWIFGLITCGSALVVAASPRLIHGVFGLFFCFFGVAGLYAVLGADFLAAVQVVIYIGGILVLLIFGVVLTHRRTEAQLPNPVTNWKPTTILCLLVLVLVLTTPAWWRPAGGPTLVTHDGNLIDGGGPARGSVGLRDVRPHVGNTTGLIGLHLLTTYVVAFEVASIVLLMAMLGAATIARKEVA